MSDRKMIGLPSDVYERFVKYGKEDDSDLAIVRRILDMLSGTEELPGRIVDLVSTNEHLQKQVDDLSGELEADRQLADKQVDDYAQKIEALERELHDKQTAVVPVGGQVTLDSFGSLGMKDIAEEIREGCGGDETCTATVLKLQQIRTEAISKHLDRDHDAEQKRLDREQVELDRKLKEDTAAKDREEKEKDRNNKLELNLLKKGIVRKSFLEDAAFVNISSVPKRPNKEIENRKRQARAAADDEEEWFDPEAEEELLMPEDFGEAV